jgi:hypothetical protein
MIDRPNPRPGGAPRAATDIRQEHPHPVVSMNVLRSTIGAALVASAAVPRVLAAQAPEVVPAAMAARPDSARVLHGARLAQAEFERTRYHKLPWSIEQAGGGGANCDERVGRFCLWTDDIDDNWRPPAEAVEVATARVRLIALLDSAAAAFPGDGWVAGQRVRYLVEDHRFDAARKAARECRAEPWWCQALDGYALHFAGDYRAAEQAFAAAKAAMSPVARSEWDELSPAVNDADAKSLDRLPPARRDSAVRTLWWLAQPFWMDEGNDRLTEHYARLVAERMQDRSRNVEGIYWADDLREILIRWGLPSGWERLRPPVGQTEGPVVTHYPPRFEFIPRLSMVLDPLSIRADDWHTGERHSHSLYAPPGMRRLNPLSQQVAVFRRNGQSRVVAAFAMKPDSMPINPQIDAGLVLMRAPDAERHVARAKISGTRGTLQIDAVLEQTLISLETREPLSERTARARFGIDLRRRESHGVSLSDVLLLDHAGARPHTLEEALQAARPGTSVRAGERVAVFWETYGVARTDSVTYSVSLTRRESGARPGATPVRMRFTEAAGADAIAPRALGIAIPRVSPGTYVLHLLARTRSGAEVSTEREITVTR